MNSIQAHILKHGLDTMGLHELQNLEDETRYIIRQWEEILEDLGKINVEPSSDDTRWLIECLETLATLRAAIDRRSQSSNPIG